MVEFTTSRGAAIKIEIVTERENLADRNFRVPCYDLRISINGRRMTWEPELRNDHAAAHGWIVTGQIGGVPIIPLPEPDLVAVKAVFDDYRAGLDDYKPSRRPAMPSWDREQADEDKLNG